MFQRNIPEWLRHAPTPSARGFAALAGVESASRSILISVFPIVMYRAFQDAALVSEIYLAIGAVSMVVGFMVPSLTRRIPRRWVYTLGAALLAFGALLAIEGSPAATALALLCCTVAAVTVFVCFNAYVLDFIAQAELGRSETLRLFYSALAWTLGPACGIWLLQFWPPAPFLISAAAAAAMLSLFWWMRLGSGRLIARARAPAPNPLAYLGRFVAQPRLVAGWLFAVVRSSGWWVYIVYVPIFAVQSGLGENLGGMVLSISNGLLFTTPLMLKWLQRRSIRRAVRTGFFCAGCAFALAALASPWPWLTVALLMVGSAFLVLLDISAGLPFLMAVKPSERTEMSAVYASFRDVSGILTPAAAWLVLSVAPLAGVFAAAGAGMLGAWTLASRLNPRLGSERPPRAVRGEAA